VLAALRQPLPGIGERALRALPAGGRAIRDAAVPLLVNDLVAQPGPIVLVLDDYHVITDRVVHDTVTLLVERLPEDVHVVVATRGNPPLPLGRLRAAGELQELRTDDLAFEDDEVTRVLTETPWRAATTATSGSCRAWNSRACRSPLRRPRRTPALGARR
jgi:LuxR family maltose regulon positive regulatory protein